MSIFDLESSLERAAERFQEGPPRRKKRSDRGSFRLSEATRAILDELLSTQERPPMRSLLDQLAQRCEAEGIATPSRATVYHYIARGTPAPVATGALPDHVRSALYNLGDPASVPGPQLVFYCVNYGNLAAVSFAAGRPWIDVYRALRMRGWRPRSRGLLQAVARARGL